MSNLIWIIYSSIRFSVPICGRFRYLLIFHDMKPEFRAQMNEINVSFVFRFSIMWFHVIKPYNIYILFNRMSCFMDYTFQYTKKVTLLKWENPLCSCVSLRFIWFFTGILLQLSPTTMSRNIKKGYVKTRLSSVNWILHLPKIIIIFLVQSQWLRMKFIKMRNIERRMNGEWKAFGEKLNR